MNNKIMRVFLDTDMRCQHNGLSEIAKKQSVDVSKLEEGEHVIFINSARNRAKMYSRNNILSYLWQSKGQIDLNSLQMIPQAFDKSGKLNIDAALKASIEKRLHSKKSVNKKVSRANEVLATIVRAKKAERTISS